MYVYMINDISILLLVVCCEPPFNDLASPESVCLSLIRGSNITCLTLICSRRYALVGITFYQDNGGTMGSLGISGNKVRLHVLLLASLIRSCSQMLLPLHAHFFNVKLVYPHIQLSFYPLTLVLY